MVDRRLQRRLGRPIVRFVFAFGVSAYNYAFNDTIEKSKPIDKLFAVSVHAQSNFICDRKHFSADFDRERFLKLFDRRQFLGDRTPHEVSTCVTVEKDVDNTRPTAALRTPNGTPKRPHGLSNARSSRIERIFWQYIHPRFTPYLVFFSRPLSFTAVRGFRSRAC
jgi:hypothetical protein